MSLIGTGRVVPVQKKMPDGTSQRWYAVMFVDDCDGLERIVLQCKVRKQALLIRDRYSMVTTEGERMREPVKLKKAPKTTPQKGRSFMRRDRVAS